MEGLDIDYITNTLKSKEEYKVALRLQMVRLIAQGKSSREVADIYGVSFKNVLNWVHRFKDQGVQGLQDKSGRGRKASLNNADLMQIRHTILHVSPSDLGYSSTERWTGKSLLTWINQEYNTTFKATQIYKIIDKIGLEFENGKGFVSKK